MAETREAPRSQYPPPDNPNQGNYYQHQGSPGRDERGAPHYPPPHDAARQGPPPQHPYPYPPPASWPGQHHSAPYPPYDPHAPAGYHYPPPHGNGAPQQLHPDPNRIYLPYPPPPYSYPYPAAPQAPAPRQRTAIACKYCRKRKIRCSGYDNSPDGRCQNCVRFNQQCLFHPVSSQAAFVPASALYGPNGANTRAPQAGQGDRPASNGQDPPPMLYGAHGQPLGPVPPQAQGPYPYPPPGYYPYPPPGAHPGAPHGGGAPYEAPVQSPAPGHGESVSNRKRPPPDDDSHNEDTHSSQSPHPTARPRHNNYEPRTNSTGSYDYPEPTNMAPTSPATSTMSYQSHGPGYYANGAQAPKDTTSPTVTSGLTPNSAHSYNSPRAGPVRDDGKTPPPNSAGSSVNGSRMHVYDVLSDKGDEKPRLTDSRPRNDSDMLSKLDGKKK